MAYLRLDNIEKSFGAFKASKGVSFEVGQGKLVALLGPSGSGKTTILRLIAGLEAPDAGDIFIGGARVNDLPAGSRDIGFVFQNYALFRHMTVSGNIAFGLRVKKFKKAEIASRVAELVALVGLEGMESRYPHQLSGGQRQRVAFARAIAPNPRLLLLDEPFAAIDARVRQELRRWLRGMIDRLRITSLFVTHDQEEAVELSDEIIVINDGRVEQKGAPEEIYNAPLTPFVADFIGSSNAIENARALKGFESIGDYSRAVVRPEYVVVGKNGGFGERGFAAETGTVESVVFRGGHRELKIRVGGETLTVNRVPDGGEFSEGDEVGVLIRRIHAFDGERAFVLDNANLKDVAACG
jgi:sulfate transport system ATP-binding protein